MILRMKSILLSNNLLHKEMKTFRENFSFILRQCNPIFFQAKCFAGVILSASDKDIPSLGIELNFSFKIIKNKKKKPV